MIPLIDSFSFGTRKILPIEYNPCLLDSFSLGVLDKRYPKNDKVILRQMSVGYIENEDYQDPKIIRVK